MNETKTESKSRMANKRSETRATERANTARADKDNSPLSARDALALALNELERLACVLEDFAESARTMINVASMNDDHKEYAAFLRNFERILHVELDECGHIEEMISPTLYKLRADDSAAKTGNSKTK